MTVDWRVTMEARMGKMEECSEQVMLAVAGVPQIDGTRSGGLVQDMRWVKAKLEDGLAQDVRELKVLIRSQVPRRLTGRDRVLLWVAVIGLIGTMVTAIVGALA